MPLKLFERYKELQAYVGWTDEDATRVASVAAIVEANMDAFIRDFYVEVQRHPEAARVITGGSAQIARLTASLRAWLTESLECRSDIDYVQRRWKIGLRHAEIGLNPAYTSAAMSRLRNGLINILATETSHSPAEFCGLVQSFNKLLDLDLAIIQDAYEAEFLSREKVAERERSEVKFRHLVEAAACAVIILRRTKRSHISARTAKYSQGDRLRKLRKSHSFHYLFRNKPVTMYRQPSLLLCSGSRRSPTKPPYFTRMDASDGLCGTHSGWTISRVERLSWP